MTTDSFLLGALIHGMRWLVIFNYAAWSIFWIVNSRLEGWWLVIILVFWLVSVPVLTVLSRKVVERLLPEPLP